MKKYYCLAIFVALILFFSSCKDEDHLGTTLPEKLNVKDFNAHVSFSSPSEL